MKNRLIAIFYLGFIIGVATMLPEIQPHMTTKTTWIGVISFASALAIPMLLGYLAGLEQNRKEI